MRDAWVTQSVKHPTLAQVMMSQLVSSSPTSGSVLRARLIAEPASDPVSLSLFALLCWSLSLSLFLSFTLSLSLSQNNK